MPSRKKPRAPKKTADPKKALAGQKAVKQQLLQTVTDAVAKKKP